MDDRQKPPHKALLFLYLISNTLLSRKVARNKMAFSIGTNSSDAQDEVSKWPPNSQGPLAPAASFARTHRDGPCAGCDGVVLIRLSS
jgi:hypothetical protein